MAENPEKKILVTVEVLDNFIEAQKKAEKYKRSIAVTESVIANLKSEQIQLKSELIRGIVTQAAYDKAIEKTSKSIESYNKKLHEGIKLSVAADTELREAKKALGSAAKSEELLNVATDNVNKSLGEMQRELSALKI
ncbi:MAG: hypothetical protein LBH34_05110 [Prevotellaceae bacterium]|jgi:hypothetical protein|nr:hypothetical protein [Prevotellaceae bacterium]